MAKKKAKKDGAEKKEKASKKEKAAPEKQIKVKVRLNENYKKEIVPA